MADNFGLKIGVEGEKEFKKALAEINQNFKVLGSEMKLVSSQFGKNDKSVDALTARNQVLNKEINEQKSKIELLKQALDTVNCSGSRHRNCRKSAITQGFNGSAGGLSLVPNITNFNNYLSEDIIQLIAKRKGIVFA